VDDVDYKVRIGPEVKARLLAHPQTLQIPSYDLDLFVVREFLTPEECERLIEIIDARREPSKLLSPIDDPDFRTSDSCNVDPTDRFIRKIERKIAALLGIAPEKGETIQGQRYDVGQRFKPHFDCFSENQPYWAEIQKSGGQRTWTAMIFLNEPEGGGATNFPSVKITVTPRRGNMLVWNNLNIIGEPNQFALHEGLPVTAGVKYIITKWHRERPWGHANVPYY
jgi:prolyl 4-hydroxylase